MESFEAFFVGDAQGKRSLDSFKLYSDNFEKALKSNDRTTASLALDQIKREIRNVKAGSF